MISGFFNTSRASAVPLSIFFFFLQINVPIRFCTLVKIQKKNIKRTTPNKAKKIYINLVVQKNETNTKVIGKR